MRKYFSGLSFLLVIAFGCSRSSNPSQSELREMLCHKWKMISLESEGESEKGNGYVIFKEDGRFINSQEGKEQYTEKWSYDRSNMSLITGDMEHRIVKINEKDLILSSEMDGKAATVTLSRVD